MAQRAMNMPAMSDRATGKRAIEQRTKLDALMATLSRQIVVGAPCGIPTLKDAGAWMSPAQMLALFSDRVETSHLCAYPGCPNTLGAPSLRRYVLFYSQRICHSTFTPNLLMVCRWKLKSRTQGASFDMMKSEYSFCRKGCTLVRDSCVPTLLDNSLDHFLHFVSCACAGCRFFHGTAERHTILLSC